MANQGEGDGKPGMESESVLREFEWRYRLSRYLEFAAFLWILVGILLDILHQDGRTVWDVTFGLLTVAFAVKLAVFRCPVCNRNAGWDSTWTPGPYYCKRCGALLR